MITRVLYSVHCCTYVCSRHLAAVPSREPGRDFWLAPMLPSPSSGAD